MGLVVTVDSAPRDREELGVLCLHVRESLIPGNVLGFHRVIGQRDDLVPVPPGGWLRSAQREEPPRVGGLPQVQLRAAEMRLNAPWILHGFDALVIGRQVERILREGGGLIFDG